MKAIEGTKSTAFYIYASLFFIATLLLPKPLFNLGLGVWGIASIQFLLNYRRSFRGEFFSNKLAIASVLLWSVMAIGLLWSPDLSEAWSPLERLLLFLIAPLFCLPIAKRFVSRSILKGAPWALLCGILVVLAIGLWNAITRLVEVGAFTGDLQGKELWEQLTWNLTSAGFAARSGTHHVFFSAYLITCVFMLLDNYRIYRYVSLGVTRNWVLFLSIWIFLMQSANLSFVYLLLLILYQIKYGNLRRGEVWRYRVLSGLLTAGAGIVFIQKSALVGSSAAWSVVLVMCIVVALSFPSLLKTIQLMRVKIPAGAFLVLFLCFTGVSRYLPNHQGLVEFAQSNPSNMSARVFTWKCANSIIDASPITGVGLGRSHENLLEEYEDIEFAFGLKWKYNEHNQYLRFWMEGGLLALIAFAYLIFRAGQVAHGHRHFAMTALLIVTLFFCLTESALNRRLHIALFAYLLMLYSYSAISEARRIRQSR